MVKLSDTQFAALDLLARSAARAAETLDVAEARAIGGLTPKERIDRLCIWLPASYGSQRIHFATFAVLARHGLAAQHRSYRQWYATQAGLALAESLSRDAGSMARHIIDHRGDDPLHVKGTALRKRER